MKSKHCEWCDKQFETDIKYQIYCSPECRADATKEKIYARYQIARIKNRAGKTRLCKSCGGHLSAYNDEPLCQHCLVNPDEVKKALRKIKGASNGKDWTD